jgi:hypothetical protein
MVKILDPWPGSAGIGSKHDPLQMGQMAQYHENCVFELVSDRFQLALNSEMPGSRPNHRV